MVAQSKGGVLNVAPEQRDTIGILTCVLADEYALYMRIKGASWCLAGTGCEWLRIALRTHYEQLDVVVDDLAERLCACDRRVAGARDNRGRTGTGRGMADMVATLIADHRTVIVHLVVARAACEARGQRAELGAFLTCLIERHEMMAWLLAVPLHNEQRPGPVPARHLNASSAGARRLYALSR